MADSFDSIVGGATSFGPRYLLFLSHSGIDTEEARELKRRLEESSSGREAGLKVWFDKDDLQPGQTWQSQLEAVLTKGCTAFAVYVGSKGVVNWVESEVRLGLSRAVGNDRFPFIPVLAAKISSSGLPPFAAQYHAVRDPLCDPAEMTKLLTSVLGGQDRAIDWKIKLLAEPFIGLRAMTEADADRFFGRKAELDDLVTKLRRSRLVAVVADSGSGKSSLVQAGLIPRFRGGAFRSEQGLEPDGRIWHVVVMRPGTSPIERLRTAVTAAAEKLGLLLVEKTHLRESIDPAKPTEMAYALQCGLPAQTTETLLIIDQFEELFTQTPEDQRTPFLDWLLSLVMPGATLGFRVVLTIRNDYFNLCSGHAALFALLQTEAAQFRLKQVTPEGLKAIVSEPLKLAGHIKGAEHAALVSQIRSDVSDRPGDLALVQMALYETWLNRRAHGDDLIDTYIAIGKVQGALAHAAEDVRTNKLSPNEQRLLEAVLVRLITLGDTGGATRRVARIVEFDEAHQNLIKKLADDTFSRLVLTGGGDKSAEAGSAKANELTSDETTIEICHEQLVTQWPWWQTWIRANSLNMRRLARLMDKARDWAAAPTDKRAGFLATGADLEIFSALLANHTDWLSKEEQVFVGDSVGQHDEANRKDEEARETERRLRQEAEDKRKEAEASRAEAEERRQEAEASRKEAEVSREEAERRQHEAEESRKDAEVGREDAQKNAALARYRLRWAAGLAILLAIAALAAALEMINAGQQTTIAQEQRNRAVRSSALLLAGQSAIQLQKGDAMTALLLAIEGLRDVPAAVPAEATEPAAKAAVEAYDQLREIRIFQNVSDFAFSSDEATVVLIQDGSISARSIANGNELWRKPLGEHVLKQMWPLERNSMRIIWTDGTMETLSLLDGSSSPTTLSADPKTECSTETPRFRSFLNADGSIAIIDLNDMSSLSLVPPKRSTRRDGSNCSVDVRASNVAIRVANPPDPSSFWLTTKTSSGWTPIKDLGDEEFALHPTNRIVVTLNSIDGSASLAFRDLSQGLTKRQNFETPVAGGVTFSNDGAFVAINNGNRSFEIYSNNGERLNWPSDKAIRDLADERGHTRYLDLRDLNGFDGYPSWDRSDDYGPLAVGDVHEYAGIAGGMIFGSQAGVFFSAYVDPSDPGVLTADGSSLFRFPVTDHIAQVAEGMGGRIIGSIIDGALVIWARGEFRPTEDSTWAKSSINDSENNRDSILNVVCHVVTRDLTDAQREEFSLVNLANEVKLTLPSTCPR
ncbi:TIR domain-containing protein [Mesorhizobium kowhaii]|uniref:nSTAND1 domain-containing NTPase n=1 Tax=Mesorhizobium kowhaii TaxID=1300272 RepID=UPI0035EAD70F